MRWRGGFRVVRRGRSVLRLQTLGILGVFGVGERGGFEYVAKVVATKYVAVGGILYSIDGDKATLLYAPAAMNVENVTISAEKSRADVEAEWCEKYASAVAAAEKGDVDDVIEAATLRARICSAFYMLAVKADGIPERKYARTPV